MRTLVTALSAPIAAGVTEIVFIPEGIHKITPKSQPDGIDIKVMPEQGPAIAATLQADLTKRLGENVLPWLDFEHSRKYPASGHPKSFRYEKGKGVMCTVEWSRSGRLALRGRDANYFSPEFYIDKDGVPNGIPNRGPVGTLCTEPAFREIPRIAATDAAQPNHDLPNVMDSLLIFATCGLLTSSEAALPGAEALAKQRVAAMQKHGADLVDLQTKFDTLTREHKELQTKVTASEAKAKETAEKRADDLITAALADGRLAPGDEDTKKDFRERIAAGDAFAEKMLAQRPKTREGLDRPIISASLGDRHLSGSGLDAKASALVTAGQAKTLDEARELVLASDPDAYNEYLKTLRTA